ncbi:MAG: tetratricopeptide repeat protein [Candidatus Obscuribacterales bacterium]|nr:tetratricopeptide repeat protein [Candidatus Obscuribacterales bacterium]
MTVSKNTLARNVICKWLPLFGAVGAIVLLSSRACPASDVAASTPRSSTDSRVLVREGISLMHLNKNQEAVDKLQQAVSLNGDSPEAYHSLALVLSKIGKMNDAIAAMRKALELRPDSDASWLTLGGFYQSNGNIEEALATYKAFLERFPDHKMKRKVEALRDSLTAEQRESKIRQEQDRILQDRPSTQERSIVAPLAAEFSSGNDDYLAQMFAKGVNRWPRERIPITVYIHDGAGVPGYREAFGRILRRSFDDWSTASDRQVAFAFVNSPKEARLQCFWTDRVADTGNAAEAGDARISMDQDGICKSEIWFLTQPVSKTIPLTDNYFRLVSLHEIGHGLGMSGHTTNPDDIMFYSATFKDVWRELSGRDSRSVKRLYKDL